MTPVIYFIVLAFELYAEVQMQVYNSAILLFITKPLLMILLMVWVYRSNFNQPKIKNLLILALMFSWLGDVFLMFLPWFEKSFLLGLGAFLLAHVFYINVFVQESQGLQKPPLLHMSLIIAYGVGLMLFLIHWQTPAFEKMKPAVFIYALVIL